VINVTETAQVEMKKVLGAHNANMIRVSYAGIG